MTYVESYTKRWLLPDKLDGIGLVSGYNVYTLDTFFSDELSRESVDITLKTGYLDFNEEIEIIRETDDAIVAVYRSSGTDHAIIVFNRWTLQAQSL